MGFLQKAAVWGLPLAITNHGLFCLQVLWLLRFVNGVVRCSDDADKTPHSAARMSKSSSVASVA